MQPLLRARQLSLRWGDRVVLAGADLDLFPGELVALLGPSGGGKSTLLRVLCGLLGENDKLWLSQQPVSGVGWPKWRRRVHYIPQTPCLLPMSVSENLRRPFLFASAENPPDPERGQALLADLGLPAVWQRDASSLSVGEQQRVCLVRGLLLQPHVLLLDEPTAALDAACSAKVESLVQSWAAETQAAVLLVTHDQARVSGWATRALELVGGELTKRVVGQGAFD